MHCGVAVTGRAGNLGIRKLVVQSSYETQVAPYKFI